MLTAFGRALRKIRIDRNLLLKDMADALRCSSPFLSAIESGKKKIPEDMIDRISNYYGLNSDEIQSLKDGRDQSLREVVIGLEDYCAQDRDLALAFARKFDALGGDQKKELKRILTGGSKCVN